MAELHAALRDGRHDAFEALHEGYAQSIYNLALRIVDRLYGADAAALAASQLEYFGEGWRDPTVNAEFATDPVPPVPPAPPVPPVPPRPPAPPVTPMSPR